MENEEIKYIRTIHRTEEFTEFLETADERTIEKIIYISEILKTQKVINTKTAKKLTNSILYEIRIKVDNEYRIITYSIDHENINQATNILFISAFLKKSTKDYDKQIKKALKILEQWTDQN